MGIADDLGWLAEQPQTASIGRWLRELSLRSITISVDPYVADALKLSASTGGEPFRSQVDVQIALATIEREKSG